MTCPCSYHHPSEGEYPTRVELDKHLQLVQDIENAMKIKFTFIGPYLLEAKFLSDYNLTINTQYCLLLCLSCRCAIVPAQLKSHLQSKHAIPLIEEDKKAIGCLLTVCKVELSALPTLHDKTISRIDGLPVQSGHPCPSCNVVRLTYESLKAHMRQHHKGVSYPAEDIKVNAQQLRTGTFVVRVHVLEEVPSKFSTDDILAQAKAMQEVEDGLAAVEASSSNDHRDYCPWLRNVRWQDLTEGKDISKLIGLVAFPKPEEFPRLKDGLLFMLDHATGLLDSTPELILQGLNTAKQTDE